MSLKDLFEHFDYDTLVEISNGKGDHIVAHIPDNQVNKVEFDLEQAGAVPDNDESLAQKPNAERVYRKRNLEQYRFRSSPIYTQDENLEENGDHEPEEQDNDMTLDDDHNDLEPDYDSEYSEQAVTLNPFTWHRPQRSSRRLETRPTKESNPAPLVQYREDFDHSDDRSSTDASSSSNEALKADWRPWTWHRPQ